MQRWTLKLLALALIGLALASCMTAGEVKSDTQSVGFADEEVVAVDVRMDTGRLAVSGGATPLMEGDFRYNVDAMKPEVTYRKEDRTGTLTLHQPGRRLGLGPFGTVEYAWDVRLNETVPLDLRMRLGTVESDLDLGDLNLAAMALTSEAGGLSADMPGDHPVLSTIDMEAKSGSLLLGLEGEHPALEQATLQGNSGSMKVVLAGEYAKLGEVTLQTASGSIDAALLGTYAAPLTARIETSSGDLLVALTGTWQQDLTAALTTSSGSVTVRLPTDVGVIVKATSDSGAVNAAGLRADGENLVNEAYRNSDVTLRVTIEVSSGDINLELEEAEEE